MSKWDGLIATIVKEWVALYVLAAIFYVIVIAPCLGRYLGSLLDPYTLHKVTLEGMTMEVAVHTNKKVVTLGDPFMGDTAIFEEENGEVSVECLSCNCFGGTTPIRPRPASSEEVKLFRTFYK